MYLGQVAANHAQDEALSVYPMTRTGAMRPRDAAWKLESEAEMVGYLEVVAVVALEPNGQLTAESIETLIGLGIAV